MKPGPFQETPPDEWMSACQPSLSRGVHSPGCPSPPTPNTHTEELDHPSPSQAGPAPPEAPALGDPQPAEGIPQWGPCCPGRRASVHQRPAARSCARSELAAANTCAALAWRGSPEAEPPHSRGRRSQHHGQRPPGQQAADRHAGSAERSQRPGRDLGTTTSVLVLGAWRGGVLGAPLVPGGQAGADSAERLRGRGSLGQRAPVRKCTCGPQVSHLANPGES